MRATFKPGWREKGVILIGLVFFAVAMAVGIYASTLSLQVASRNIRNKELVMHAQMGAEGAIEMGIRMLNSQGGLTPSATIYPGGYKNSDCDAQSLVAGNVNSVPLTHGNYLLSNSTGVFGENLQVNYAVNLDLNGDELLSASKWITRANQYEALIKNAGYPETGRVLPNSYSGSQTGMDFIGYCYNTEYLRLLRAEANVVRVGSENAPNPFRRRIAAVISIDPNCDQANPTFTGYGGCKAEVLSWYEE